MNATIKICPHCTSEDIVKELCKDHGEKKGLPFRYNVWYCYDCNKTFAVAKEVEVEHEV